MRTCDSAKGSTLAATSLRVNSIEAPKGGTSGGGPLRRGGAAAGCCGGAAGCCCASAGADARVAVKARRVVFIRRVSSFHSPALDAGGKAVLEIYLQAQARSGYGFERNRVVAILFDAPALGGFHWLPRVAILIQDVPRGGNAHAAAAGVVE